MTNEAYKKREHNRFKKIHDEYTKMLMTLTNDSGEKPVGKREYDKDPIQYNSELNSKIEVLNINIKRRISEESFENVSYNETPFDSLRDLTFGHDGLLKMFSLMWEKYPRVGKILSDKFDYLLIDEFQDTNELIFNTLFGIENRAENLTVGLFGDSMQSIYDDGVGNVDGLVSKGKIVPIKKEDNYRCSMPVIDLINSLRHDGLKQTAVSKKNGCGNPLENLDERSGSVEVFYSVFGKKPSSRVQLPIKSCI